MAYEINRYNGTLLVSVDDQTLNTTAADLKLVGRNYSGYGEIQNENFVWLLENFAGSTAPERPITGQIWYDSATKKLKFYDGTRFKSASGAVPSATAPTGLTSGEFWFDSVQNQLYAYNGTDFVLIGPDNAPVYGDAGSIPEVVKDNVGGNQSIIKITAGGTTIAVASNSSFVLNSTVNPITGFSQIKRGITLSTSDTTTGVTTTDYKIWGTAANSDRLNGFTSGEFLRASNAIFTSQVRFKDPGFSVGDQDDFKVRILNGDETTLENTLNQSLVFRISNGLIDNKDIMIMSTTGADPGSDNRFTLGTATKRWKEVHGTVIKARTFYGDLIGTSMIEASSIDLKENLRPIDNALDLVLQLAGYIYDRKDQSVVNEPGLIADYVNNIIPSLVEKDANGKPTGVKYTRLVAYLVEAIKTQQEQINELKNKD